MTRQQVINELGISKRMFYRLRNAGVLVPLSLPGGFPKYARSDLPRCRDWIVERIMETAHV